MHLYTPTHSWSKQSVQNINTFSNNAIVNTFLHVDVFLLNHFQCTQEADFQQLNKIQLNSKHFKMLWMQCWTFEIWF